MHNEEEATHAKLTTLLSDAVAPATADHGGRIVKSTGDGFLAEFSSAVEAVRAALQLQTRINELTARDAEDTRIAFRVGMNVGDVIVGPHDVFGDGVNIAQPLPPIATRYAAAAAQSPGAARAPPRAAWSPPLDWL
jgi:class 3 adenylate cyclase